MGIASDPTKGTDSDTYGAADATGRNPDGRRLRAGRAGPVLWSRRLRADPTTNAKESVS